MEPLTLGEGASPAGHARCVEATGGDFEETEQEIFPEQTPTSRPLRAFEAPRDVPQPQALMSYGNPCGQVHAGVLPWSTETRRRRNHCQRYASLWSKSSQRERIKVSTKEFMFCFRKRFPKSRLLDAAEIDLRTSGPAFDAGHLPERIRPHPGFPSFYNWHA
ncbi:MAG: hypothetical protein IT581_13990 [Verrucomicrobiales bacterium]|nr:hypothetical protein [Verrucomicrobiales bacterium]